MRRAVGGRATPVGVTRRRDAAALLADGVSAAAPRRGASIGAAAEEAPREPRVEAPRVRVTHSLRCPTGTAECRPGARRRPREPVCPGLFRRDASRSQLHVSGPKSESRRSDVLQLPDGPASVSSTVLFASAGRRNARRRHPPLVPTDRPSSRASASDAPRPRPRAPGRATCTRCCRGTSRPDSDGFPCSPKLAASAKDETGSTPEPPGSLARTGHQHPSCAGSTTRRPRRSPPRLREGLGAQGLPLSRARSRSLISGQETNSA